MPVTAPVPVTALGEWAKFAALPLPALPGGPQGAAPPADRLGLTPPPTMRALWELASAGLQQIGALLPTLARMVRDDAAGPIPLPIGHLARALGDAAHWIDAGYVGLAAKDEDGHPGMDALGAWRTAAREALDHTSDLLTRAEQRLDTSQQPSSEPSASLVVAVNPEALWALSQVASAQHQVGTALDSLAFVPSPRSPAPPRPRRTLLELRGATALLGMIAMLLLYGLTVGAWLAVASLAGTALAFGTALLWGWRVGVSASGIRLELRRPPADPQRR